MSGRLDGKRVLVTSADRYLGPAVVELFVKFFFYVLSYT